MRALVYWKQPLFEKQHAILITAKWPIGRYPQQMLMPETPKALIRDL